MFVVIYNKSKDNLEYKYFKDAYNKCPVDRKISNGIIDEAIKNYKSSIILNKNINKRIKTIKIDYNEKLPENILVVSF